MFWKKEKRFRFIATHELGRLVTWLRILGYDSVYFKEGGKRDLAMAGLREDRVILTRQAGLPRFSGTTVIRIKNDFVEDQVRQVTGELRLKIDPEKIFTRCTLCNSSIEKIEKKDAENHVPEYVYKTQSDFKACGKCNKFYWKGTHLKLANNFLKERSRA